MQSIHCPSQRPRRPVPHRASARDLIDDDCQIRSRDPPPETMVQLCLVIMGVCDDIPRARIHLSPFMSRRCRLVHRDTQFVTTIIDLTALNGLLHRTKCHDKLLFSNGWFTTSCWFDLYQTISLGSFYNHSISRWNWCAVLFLFSIFWKYRPKHARSSWKLISGWNLQNFSIFA